MITVSPTGYLEGIHSPARGAGIPGPGIELYPIRISP